MITIAHTTLCCQDNNYPNNYYQHQQPTHVDNSMCLRSRDQGGALPPAFGTGVPNIRYLPIQPNQFKKPLPDLISSLNPYDDEMVVPDSHVIVDDPPCFIASPKGHTAGSGVGSKSPNQSVTPSLSRAAFSVCAKPVHKYVEKVLKS